MTRGLETRGAGAWSNRQLQEINNGFTKRSLSLKLLKRRLLPSLDHYVIVHDQDRGKLTS